MSARDDYPDPCSATDQEAMFGEIDSLRAERAELLAALEVFGNCEIDSEEQLEAWDAVLLLMANGSVKS